MSQKNESARCYILQDKNATNKLEAQHFDEDFWRDDPDFSRVDGGRGGSIKINVHGRVAILRQYKRGGVIRHICHDRYIWLGQSNSRPWQEWRLLEDALNAGLPVAKPIGACIWRRGLMYRAAIMTEFLQGTQTLADHLSHTRLDHDVWYRLGTLLHKMQSLGFRHADLNANNLLIDQDLNIFIIDFDKGQMMAKLDNWQWAALYRLQRSLVKIDKRQPLYYREDDWQMLMDGYQSGL